MKFDKKWYKSKQIWTGIAALVVTIASEMSPTIKEMVANNPDILGYATAAALVIFRFLNKGDVVVVKDETPKELR